MHKGINTTVDEGQTIVAHSLRAEGFDASEDGSGRGTPMVPVAIQERAVADNPKAGPDGKGWQEGTAYTLLAHRTVQAVAFQPRIGRNGRGYSEEVFPALNGADAGATSDMRPCIAFGSKHSGDDALIDVSPTLRAGGHSSSRANAGTPPAVAFAQNTRDEVRLQGGDGQIAGALGSYVGTKQQTYLLYDMDVRRLTPRECERLQGFPDDYTLIPGWSGRATKDDLEQTARWIWTDDNRLNGMTWDHALALAAHPDGPRYKALGNSMAVPVMRWIGERIAMVDALETLDAPVL